MNATWEKVIALKKNDDMYIGFANSLNKEDIITIIATLDYFGADDRDLAQTYYDLSIPRYRMFDFLGMCVMERIDCKDGVKVLVHSFLKTNGVTSKFIADLRRIDYDVDRSWESIELD